MTAIFNEITKFFQGLRPLDRITVSQWADKYRFLSPVSSAGSYPRPYCGPPTPNCEDASSGCPSDSPPAVAASTARPGVIIDKSCTRVASIDTFVKVVRPPGRDAPISRPPSLAPSTGNPWTKSTRRKFRPRHSSTAS